MVLLDAVSDRFGGSRLSYQRLENALHRHWSPGSRNSSWLVVSSTNLLQFFFFFYFCTFVPVFVHQSKCAQIFPETVG